MRIKPSAAAARSTPVRGPARRRVPGRPLLEQGSGLVGLVERARAGRVALRCSASARRRLGAKASCRRGARTSGNRGCRRSRDPGRRGKRRGSTGTRTARDCAPRLGSVGRSDPGVARAPDRRPAARGPEPGPERRLRCPGRCPNAAPRVRARRRVTRAAPPAAQPRGHVLGRRARPGQSVRALRMAAMPSNGSTDDQHRGGGPRAR